MLTMVIRVRARNRSLVTPLHYAASGGYYTVVPESHSLCCTFPTDVEDMWLQSVKHLCRAVDTNDPVEQHISATLLLGTLSDMLVQAQVQNSPINYETEDRDTPLYCNINELSSPTRPYSLLMTTVTGRLQQETRRLTIMSKF